MLFLFVSGFEMLMKTALTEPFFESSVRTDTVAANVEYVLSL